MNFFIYFFLSGQAPSVILIESNYLGNTASQQIYITKYNYQNSYKTYSNL